MVDAAIELVEHELRHPARQKLARQGDQVVIIMALAAALLGRIDGIDPAGDADERRRGARHFERVQPVVGVVEAAALGGQEFRKVGMFARRPIGHQPGSAGAVLTLEQQRHAFEKTGGLLGRKQRPDTVGLAVIDHAGIASSAATSRP